MQNHEKSEKHQSPFQRWLSAGRPERPRKTKTAFLGGLDHAESDAYIGFEFSFYLDGEKGV